MKKNNKRGFDNYLRDLKESAKGAPSGEEILAEFERGDYSSLDPDLLKEIEERERKEQEDKKKKVAKPKEPQARV